MSLRSRPSIRPLSCTPTRALSSVSTWDPVTDILRKRTEQGELLSDKAQEQVARRLHRLQQALEGYDNEAHILMVQQVHDDNEEEELDKDSSDESDRNRGEGEEHSDIADNSKAKEQTPPPPLLPQIPRGLFIHGKSVQERVC